jgi:hypothetical protein
MKKLLAAALIGVILGGIVSKYLFVGSYINLILWGVVGIGIGWWSGSKKHAIQNSGVYGFVLSFVFMYVGYQGSAPIISRIPFFAILGLVGMLCGLILGLIGSFIPYKTK